MNTRSLVSSIQSQHSAITKAIAAIMGDGAHIGADFAFAGAATRALSLHLCSGKALASEVRTAATALMHIQDGPATATDLVFVIASWRTAILATVTGSKEAKDIRNAATYAVKQLEKSTGTKITWQPATESYSVEVKPARDETQLTATGTGKDAAQNGVSVSQTGAGLEVKGDDISGDVADALAEIDSDTLLRELARRCPDRATLEIMVALLDDGAFSEPVNKQAASSAA